MLSIPKFRTEINLEPAGVIDAAAAVHHRNRRRLAVFIGVFLFTLVPGLIWNLTRPPEYRASAKLKIVSGIVAPQTVTSLTGTSSAELPPPQQLELLAQAHRNCILQVGTPGFDNIIEFICFSAQGA